MDTLPDENQISNSLKKNNYEKLEEKGFSAISFKFFKHSSQLY